MKEVDKNLILEETKEENEDDKLLDEILDEIDEKVGESENGEEEAPKELNATKGKGIPTFHDSDIFPVQDKLTAFIDGYLVTLTRTDINILNKITGNERDEYLRNVKAESNQKLIYKVANRLLRFEPNTIVKIDSEELIAAGWHALAKAIKTYDYTKGWLFTTYAYRIIMNEMIQEIKRVKKKVVQKIDGQKQETLAIHISMDAPIRNDNKGNDIFVSDMIADSSDGPDKMMEKEDIKTLIMKSLDMLNPTEKYVIIYRYGLDRDIILTQKEIAEKLNQSQANISKIEKTCRAKLKILLKSSLGDNWEV